MNQYVIVTGLSGAGRSTVANAFEDLGWLVIDNLPPRLIKQTTALVTDEEKSNLAVAVGAGPFFEQILPVIEEMRGGAVAVKVVYLEAADDVLIRRFESTRRRHPLDAGGVAGAIAKERQMLRPLRAIADVVIDTSGMNIHQLREKLVGIFADDIEAGVMRTTFMSFGYKFGLPQDVDIVLDCRFLPNPYWDIELRELDGTDNAVKDFVLKRDETQLFLENTQTLLKSLLPAYVSEGKSYLTVAFGCTGGRHRSVAIASELASRFDDLPAGGPALVHRDVKK